MKKFYSIMITVALILNLFAIVTVGGSATPIEENKIINHLEDLSAEQLAELTSNEASYYVSVFIEFDYPEMDRSTLQNLDRPARNDAIEAYYYPRNLAIAQELGLSADAVSSYTPFAELQYSTVAEYEAQETFIYSLAESEAVKDIEIAVLQGEQEEGTRNISPYVSSYSLEQVFTDIGNEDNSFKGEGIKVGVLEGDFLSDGSHILTEKLHSLDGGVVDGTSPNHADKVTYLLGGLYGVATDVSFYVKAYSNSWKESIECLIAENVDIINASMGYNLPIGYDNLSAYTDYIIDVTGCLLVKSAGNNGDAVNQDYHTYISSPGSSANCITVGATDKNKRVLYRSSYYTPTEGLSKPDLVAPGGKFEFLPQIINEGLSATSYAAPIVTGIAARLMDEFPTLLTKPYLLKAVLLASCVQLPGQVNEHDEYAGAGLVNYARARTIMQQGTYGYFEKMPDLSNGEFLTSFEIQKTADTTVNIHFAQQIPGAYSANPIFTSATLLFSKFSFIPTAFPNGNSSCFVNSTNTGSIPLPNNGAFTYYYVDVYLEEDALPEDYETVAYAYTLEPSD